MDDTLYWITAIAFTFLLMAINTYINCKDKSWKYGGSDYLVTILLCIVWPFTLVAFIGAVVGFLTRLARERMSK